jgi:tetratricopeptide (TPR) repeat protein
MLAPRHILEWQQPYARSLIWDLQRRYFEAAGVEAWRQGEVPHYITSNPAIAHGYAEIVMALQRDRAALAPTDGPLHICELGVGSGRFTFHFLTALARLCDQENIPLSSFRYIATDIVDANLDFLACHPRLDPFFAAGVLDLAPFDLTADDRLALRNGTMIAAGDLAAPLVVIANYVFDGIPQDLFRIRAGTIAEVRISLSLCEPPDDLDPTDLLARLDCHFDEIPLTAPPYADPVLNRLLDGYRARLADTHLLFPAACLDGLARLQALSRGGLMLLSADKGLLALSGLDHAPPPGPALHGSFSLSINYHAFIAWCAARGGLALMPDHPPRSLGVIALLMLPDPALYRETRRAYRRHVGEFGPDDHYALTRAARARVDAMTVWDVLSHLRFARFDADFFGHSLARLHRLAPDLDPQARRLLRQAMDQVWAGYFPLGEEFDLARALAVLAYDLDDPAGALGYFRESTAVYGEDSGTLFNIAACLDLVGRHAAACGALRRALVYDPGNAEARIQLAGIERRRQTAG